MAIRVCALILSLATAAGAQETTKKAISIEDLYRTDGPRTPALSRDGTKVAYSRYWIDPETRRERTSLWIAEGNHDKARALESGEPDARSPLFSPDGRWIA